MAKNAKKFTEKQIKAFEKRKGRPLKKFVEGTEKSAEKWEKPEDWFKWTLKRLGEGSKMNRYLLWAVYFYIILIYERKQRKFLSDEGIRYYLYTNPMWASFKTPRRKTVYKARQVTGFPSYRGRAEIIMRWKQKRLFKN